MLKFNESTWLKFDGCKIVGIADRKLTPEQAKAARKAELCPRAQKCPQSATAKHEGETR